MNSPFKIIDLYIIKKFLGTYFYCILMIIGIVIMFDITEKLDDFHDSPATTSEIIVHYYLNFIPYFVNLFSPLFTFISVIFFTSIMANNTEIVAILASGVSYIRLIRPYLFSAIIIGIITFVLASSVIPPANKDRFRFEAIAFKHTTPMAVMNVHIELKPNEYVYIYRFDKAKNTGAKLSIENFNKNKLVKKLTAELITYDSLDAWTIHKYVQREIEPNGEKIKRGDTLHVHLSMSPDEFITANNANESMNNRQIKEFVTKQEQRGVGNVKPFITELQKRYSAPFAAFILTFIGVFIASRKVRGGIGLHIMLGLLISFSYILFTTISVSFSTSGNMNPVLAVWLPNISYSFLALWLYFKAQK